VRRTRLAIDGARPLHDAIIAEVGPFRGSRKPTLRRQRCPEDGANDDGLMLPNEYRRGRSRRRST